MTGSVPPAEPEDAQGSDAATDAVRRLLADARADGPIPADVATRMDSVLAGLASSSDARDDPGPTPAPVLPLPTHRRRRATGLLVAAAAIVVGGVVVSQHLPGDSGTGSPSGSAAASSEDRAGGLAGGTTSRTNPKVPQPTGGQVPPPGSRIHPVVRDGRIVVRSGRFTSDAVAARRLARQRGQARSHTTQGSAHPGCIAPPPYATALQATYQGAPAVLVFRHPMSHSQTVDLYLCGTRHLVRSTTLPYP